MLARNATVDPKNNSSSDLLMQTSETPAFSAPAKFFHWLTVLVLAVQYAIGWLMPDVHRDTKPVGLVGLHLSVGATIVLLVLIRLAWRFSHKPPAESQILPPVMRLAARVTHGLLYVLLIALPLMGWANASARGWDVSLFHVVPLPALAATGSALGHTLGDVHKLTAWVLLVLIGVHVAAALFHQFVIRDGTLGRMLPGARKMR
jgi:cytochrome b561